MHGLINRAIECFVRDTYGAPVWYELVQTLDLEFTETEPMMPCPADLPGRMLAALAGELDKPRPGIEEDIGTYLVSHPNAERLRRLLRFGGVDFADFLHSLDDLPDRARLAVPDLNLPALTLCPDGPEGYRLQVGQIAGSLRLGHTMTGLLRAMADDYGALALLEHDGTGPGAEVITIRLLDPDFAAGRRFDLGAQGQRT